MRLDIYFSYACRESYLVFAWLNRVQANGQVLDLHWHPFAIQMDDPATYWTQPWHSANSELRGFIAAEAARKQGDEFFQHFHDALERAVHEQHLELGEEATLIGAAQQAGLDLNRFQAAWHDLGLPQIAERSHKQAIDEWNLLGTPTVVFPNKYSYHLEMSDTPDEADALTVFQAVLALAVTHPHIQQFRLTNPT